MAYPTLKYTGISESREQNVISSKPQDGKVITRKKFTKTRKSFELTPVLLDYTDTAALMAHYDSVEMVSSFPFSNPEGLGGTYTVRYSEPLSYKESATSKGLYAFNTIKLTEV